MMGNKTVGSVVSRFKVKVAIVLFQGSKSKLQSERW